MCSSSLNRLIVVLSLVILAGCAGGSDGSGGGGTGGNGALKLLISNSRSFNPDIEHARIVQYRVRVTAPGLETPVEALFEGDAEEGTINDVPSGEGRTVTVEAINPNGLLIRQGEAYDVHVEGGETSDVDVSMESVPIITNIRSGNIIPNTRLKLKICSEPGQAVTISSESAAGGELLYDVSSSLSQIYPDIQTGLASMIPRELTPGSHRLTVVNEETGRSSLIDVTLIDGHLLKPAPLASAAFSNLSGTYVMTGRAGGALASSDPSGSAVWPNVLAAILNKYQEEI